MHAPIARIAVLIVLGVGAWYFYPKYQPLLEPVIGKSDVFGAQIIHPAIKTINNLLPDNIQIPTPDTNSGGDVKGETTDANTAVSRIVDEVKAKANDLAKEQIDTAKKEAGKAFCQVLIERVKSECGL